MLTTDSRIEGLGLRVLADDRKFFSVYNPSLTLTDALFQQHPVLANVFAPIAKALDTKTMQKLNSEAENKGEAPAELAERFMKEHNLNYF